MEKPDIYLKRSLRKTLSFMQWNNNELCTGREGAEWGDVEGCLLPTIKLKNNRLQPGIYAIIIFLPPPKYIVIV